MKFAENSCINNYLVINICFNAKHAYFCLNNKKMDKEKQLPPDTDLSVWITQKALADELGRSIYVVHNWVQRGKIDWGYLPGSTMKLVNKNTITVNFDHHKNK